MPTHEERCEIVAAETAAFAATVRAADPQTPVPTCGTWRLRQLVHHTGVIHRWVEAIWGRLPAARLRVTGDTALLDRWLANTAI